MKWFYTDKFYRGDGYGTPDNVLDEVEPRLGFYFTGPNSIRSEGWRVRGNHERGFRTLKAAKAHVEWVHRSEANIEDEEIA